MNGEILRLVDTIHRDKDVDKEAIFLGLEAAILSAIHKKVGESESITVQIDRTSGEIRAYDGEEMISPEALGRIAAQTGKQVLFQKIREAERDVVYNEYVTRIGSILTGTIQRFEGGSLIINLGKVEGILPRSQQSPGERFRVGERIKVLLQEVVKNQNKVKIVLSRTDTNLVRALFELEVPEVSDKTIEIKQIAREPGYRTKVAVATYDLNVDCVGACVGVRGSRIRNIVDELFGEKIDIVRWNDSIEVLIMNALKPAEISSMDLDFDNQRARVYVKPDQQSLAIGKRGQNVRLASKLTGWELDIVTVSDEDIERLRREDLEGAFDGASETGEAETDEEPAGEGEAEEGSAAVVEAPAEPEAAEAGAPGEAEDEGEDGGGAGAMESEDGLSWLAAVDGVSGRVIESLRELGVEGAEDLLDLGSEALAEIDGIDEDVAAAIIEAAARHGRAES